MIKIVMHGHFGAHKECMSDNVFKLDTKGQVLLQYSI